MSGAATATTPSTAATATTCSADARATTPSTAVPATTVIWPGRGTDTQNGGDGDDILHSLARDNQVDTIDCGPGNDVLWLNAKETTDVYVNCETVKSVTVHGDGDDS